MEEPTLSHNTDRQIDVSLDNLDDVLKGPDPGVTPNPVPIFIPPVIRTTSTPGCLRGPSKVRPFRRGVVGEEIDSTDRLGEVEGFTYVVPTPVIRFNTEL